MSIGQSAEASIERTRKGLQSDTERGGGRERGREKNRGDGKERERWKKDIKTGLVALYFNWSKGTRLVE